MSGLRAKKSLLTTCLEERIEDMKELGFVSERKKMARAALENHIIDKALYDAYVAKLDRISFLNFLTEVFHNSLCREFNNQIVESNEGKRTNDR